MVGPGCRYGGARPLDCRTVRNRRRPQRVLPHDRRRSLVLPSDRRRGTHEALTQPDDPRPGPRPSHHATDA